MQTIDQQGASADSEQKKKTRFRGLNSLAAIRKELVRLYVEARTAGSDPEKVTFYRGLCYILNTAAGVRKDEALEDIEKRLQALEGATK